MCLAKISLIEEGYAFLPVFLQELVNFDKVPQNPIDAHRALLDTHDLDRMFCADKRRSYPISMITLWLSLLRRSCSVGSALVYGNGYKSNHSCEAKSPGCHRFSYSIKGCSLRSSIGFIKSVCLFSDCIDVVEIVICKTCCGTKQTTG